MAKPKGLNISEDLQLPVDAVTSTMVVYGGKGMGKTNFGGVLVEELAAAGMRWAVLDPMGVWWGMRYAADGKANGVECLILGGAKGDIPIEPTGGAVVADLVADERVNVIVDISRKANGEMWSIGERIRFVRDYGKQLFRRQGSLVDGKRREPICQVMDEAARFIPQMIGAGEPDVAQCMGIWRAIVEEGRNVGIGVVLLTQRSARLNKDVAELADMMLAFRTVGPNSIKAITDWLGAHVTKADMNAMVEQVRTLKVGNCLAVSPGWLGTEKVIAIRKRWTFDSSATPKPGESTLRVRGEGAKPDLDLYAQRMSETIERAKEDDPKALKARIRELESSLAKKPAAAPAAEPVVKIVPDPATVTENQDLRRELQEIQRSLWNEVGLLYERMAKVADGVRERLGQAGMPYPVTKLPSMPKIIRQVDPPTVALTFPPHRVTPTKPATFDGADPSRVKLTGNALKIASIAAAYGKEGVDKKLLATLCGATIGGSFSARISEARTAGAVLTEGAMVKATPEGIAQYADAWHVPTTTEEVLSLWRPRLSGVALQIFDHLVSLRGRAISRAELAEAVGATMGGSFSARLSEARSTQLLVESGTQVGVNRELLFLG